MSMLKPGPGPSADLARAARKFRALADDLDRMAIGGYPTAEDLSTAPILYDWSVVVSTPSHLLGTVHGHPHIADGLRCETSPLISFDPVSGYARTYSRFYRLAPRPLGRGLQ